MIAYEAFKEYCDKVYLAVLSGAAELFSLPFDLERDPITLFGRD